MAARTSAELLDLRNFMDTLRATGSTPAVQPLFLSRCVRSRTGSTPLLRRSMKTWTGKA